jgi:hypothetical protein
MGPEFIAKAVQDWITLVGAKTAYIDRGRVETCFFDLPIAAADRQEKRWRACLADEFSRRWPA